MSITPEITGLVARFHEASAPDRHLFLQIHDPWGCKSAICAEAPSAWEPPIEALSCNASGLLVHAWALFASPLTHKRAIHITAEGQPSASTCQQSASRKQVLAVCISRQVCIISTSRWPWHPMGMISRTVDRVTTPPIKHVAAMR